MNVTMWRLGLRLARRDALANRARTALVVVLIGLPILVLTVVDIGYRTFQLGPTQKLERTIGTADAGVQWSGLDGDVHQGPEGWMADSGVSENGSAARSIPTAAQLTTLLPAGARVIAWNTDDSSFTFRTRAGLERTTFTGLDLADPLTRGIARISSGRAPRTTSEVALTTSLARSSGLRLGDRLNAVDPARTYRVVGMVTDGSRRTASTAYTVPAGVTPSVAQVSRGLAVLGWLARTDRPVTWTDVRRLNRAGFAVVSRAEYLHPSPAARASGAALTSGSSDVTTYAVPVALVAGMALLEVVLLAGPAFAVGAKRRRRDLALIAATGATPRQLQRIVLCSGVVLGLLAGVVGVAIGTAVAALGEPVLARHASDVPGPFDVRPWELLGVLAVALVTALVASLAPARAAARTEVVAALAGRRGEIRVRRRTPLLGLALIAAGTVIALNASVGTLSTTAILVGVVVAEIGLIACTPVLIVLAARAGSRFPLPARLALRDAGRNRSAATPAVAAVMAAVIGATALMLGTAAQDDRGRRQYVPALPPHAATARVDGLDDAAAAILQRGVSDALPTSASAVVHGFPYECPTAHRGCTVVSLTEADDVDSRVQAQVADSVIVSDGSDVMALFGRDRPDLRAALRAGRAVVADPAAVRSGYVRLALNRTTLDVDGHDVTPPGPAPQTIVVPATVQASGFMPAQVIVPTSIAAQHGLATVPSVLFVRTTRAPTDAELQTARAAYHRDAPLLGDLYVERGYQSRYATLELALVAAAVAIAVLGAVVATALANVDGRDDLRTLGAIGAAPRVRRTLSGARAAVIAGLGTLVGVPAGVLVPLALLRQSRSGPHTATSVLHFVVPWPSVVALLVAVPLIAAGVAAALTRSRLPTGAVG